MNLESRDNSQSLLTTIFTLSTLAVGFMTYLYNRISHTVEDQYESIHANRDAIQELHENVNDMFLRMEEMPTKETEFENTIQEDMYQAWIGTKQVNSFDVWICMLRKKLDTYKQNKEWMNWEPSNDASVTVRDYYMDTFDSDFKWQISEENGVSTANLSETMVNGWRSVIRIHIKISHPSDEKVSMEQYANIVHDLKQYGDIQWERQLVRTG